ncbi:putative polysaccharide biosynthesis protein [Loigolactobacillus bifermentans]|uniref:Integral membrane protein n=1 Tax=Loigolactobacillus bifermentans DSM 20003 TaxID=1423726 RepID=A0A0R1H377_9LACO|nr:polysaccharide biosynthesis protein [Loigolactobacillus bifermentans]KRK40928.1 integral membrane protein [Loigolactobacillus bifermentans DSM 20003]QGG61480.1 oligosaccharide flippase family protein [Loigolactobacillus bifermentans]
MDKTSEHVLNGAFVLTLAGLIAKILSAVYRVPFQNIVGNTGFYVYQQVYPLYGIGMTFALAGFPVFMSKLIAEQTSPLQQQQLLRQSTRLLWGLSLVLFLILQVGAQWLARLMGDEALAPLIHAVAWMFLAMPFLATRRGYYQGVLNMLPTAWSQVAEQVVRVTVILVAAALAQSLHWSVYRMGTWAMSSAFFGALAAVAVLAWAWWRRPLCIEANTVATPFAWRPLIRRFLLEGGSICLFAALLILYQLVDSFTVKKGLELAGLSSAAAKNAKGIYDRGQPLVQLGLVLATAFSSALLPRLTKARQQGASAAFYQIAGMMIQIGLGIALAATAGLIALLPGVNRLLFGDVSGQWPLAWYLVSIVLMTMISTYSSVWQSEGHYRLPTFALGVGLVLKMIGNTWAVQHWQTVGTSVMTVIALSSTFVIIWLGSAPRLRTALTQRHFVWKLVGSTLVMLLVAAPVGQWLLQHPQLNRLAVGGISVLASGLGATVFIISAWYSHLFSQTEWQALPGGDKLIKRQQERTHKHETR